MEEGTGPLDILTDISRTKAVWYQPVNDQLEPQIRKKNPERDGI